MGIEKRIEAFAVVGKALDRLSSTEFDELAARCRAHNAWFATEDVSRALKGIAHLLKKEQLTTWVGKYGKLKEKQRVGVVMAGNIPAVGFHDYLCILLSGNQLVAKLSSQDSVLLSFIHSVLTDIAPDIAKNARFVDRLDLDELDKIIATGSDNSARYFETYFQKRPSIIRKNRTSVAVLDGRESNETLEALGKDIFTYYGLGCRNVSKLYVPKGYEFPSFFEAMESQKEYLMYQNKYINNYEYNRSIYLINGDEHLDNGFLMVKKSEELVSPISVLFYEEYENKKELEALKSNEKVQCVVGEGFIPFGEGQFPNPWDYADGVDVFRFLDS
ncbi:MAG: acyl-CoA reductase [Cyclobacteriaceae bacterium]